MLKLDQQMCFALYAATNAVTRAYRPLLAKLGLTYPQYLIMITLWEHGSASIRDIAAWLKLGANAVSPVVDQLERAAFVRRVRSTADRRMVIVALTETGQRLHDAAAGAQHEVACRIGLDDEGFASLRAKLHALVDHMEEDASADAHAVEAVG